MAVQVTRSGRGNRGKRGQQMSVSKESFGTAGGRAASLYVISNGGTTLKLTDFGACIVSILVPDRDGRIADVAPGYDSAEGYAENPCFLGAVIGPSANRIAGGRFTMDGRTWQLPVNENDNNLHTDFAHGSHKRFWQAETAENSVTFTLPLADGEFGTPGNRIMQLEYSVTGEGTVRLHYHADSDKKTLMNLTNHCYFNLAGEDAGSIEQQTLRLHCASYCPVRPDSIPTGEILKVEGTPLDFKAKKPIGRDIGADFRQLVLTGGFDHNFVIDGWKDDGVLRPAAEASDPASGRMMEVFTTLPGVQFYSGNFLKVEGGKGGRSYAPRAAFCLETQYFPDSMNHENFAHPVFGAGRAYDSVTEYRFSCRG